MSIWQLGYGNDNAQTNGEMFLYNFLKRSCKIIFDVGVDDSVYYLTESNIQYHLFEPNPIAYNILKEKTKEMGNVKVNNIGLGLEERTLPFFPACMSLIKRGLIGNNDRSIDVKITTLDKYISENPVNHIDFLKIDTEGWELDVIKGSFNSLKMISHIQFEYGGCWIDGNIHIKDMIDILCSVGFETFLILPDKLIRVDDFSDHGMYCNYFATCKIEKVLPIIDMNLSVSKEGIIRQK